MPSYDDPRYLLAWWGLEKIERVVRSPGKPIDKARAQSLLNEMWSELKRLRWSGLPSDMASSEAQKIAKLAGEMREVLGLTPNEKELVKSQAYWALGYLQALPHLLKLGEDVSPGEAVYVVSGRITEVGNHPNADNLKVTRVNVGYVAITVVTNIKEVKEGEVRAVALLPPVDLLGVISRGMFCSDPLQVPEGRPFPPYDKGSVRAQVERIAKEALKIRK
ncbi:hypothetical protein [Ignicoccus islandicus]|uniref:hypothetical protein n=1 Tax=Ignicoccus islandicus TaxID=54259 RepID=UPI0009462E83|nr:hypothetical protein [Ignicoccus islandicus]